MRQIQVLLGLLFTLPLAASNLIAQAAAGATPPPAPSLGQVFFNMLPAFCLAFLIFHFLVIKPQRNKQKQQQDLLGSLKKGDTVVTSGGLHGRVAGIEKDYILLEVASNVRLKLEREHIARKIELEKASQAAA